MPEPRRLIRRQPSSPGAAPLPAPRRPTTGASLTAAGNQAIQRSVVPAASSTRMLTAQELDVFIGRVNQAITDALGVSAKLSRSDFDFLSSSSLLASRTRRRDAKAEANQACNANPVAVCACEPDPVTCQQQVRTRQADTHYCQSHAGQSVRMATPLYYEQFLPLGGTALSGNRASGASWINTGSSTFSISNRSRMATLVHEALHRLAHPGWNRDLMNNTYREAIDEGAVQLMTAAVFDKLGPPFTADDAFSRPQLWSTANCALLMSGAPTFYSQIAFLRHAFFSDDPKARAMRQLLLRGAARCAGGGQCPSDMEQGAQMIVGLATLGEFLIRELIE